MDTRKSGRRYDREFKENAVALVQSGRSATQVARDLGVSTWSLNRWVQQARAGSTQGEPNYSGCRIARAARVASAAPGERMPAQAARHLKKSCWHLIGRDAAQRFTV